MGRSPRRPNLDDTYEGICQRHDFDVYQPSRALKTVERIRCLRYNRAWMPDMFLGCLKWAAVGFVVAFTLMKLFEASHIHDDIPKPAFKIRQTNRATFVLSTFAAMLSALVWLLVQKLD